ncbi:hypothetical protein M3G18_08000 [Corynebacterium sp. p3-SID1145]|uniref:hypothetical protein n=1 Tax=unclassified Corynebacterium TaxID=2624378 RepID=UPI0021A97E8D|nr:MULTISPECIES: hypothetical protein [unclassified Corynebacterium]MCT1452842.1 hypothetical protein [Corynebacterium sp. p3-SID1145]MCT1461758.1 hypothetical protein [Corynebacterium sp. p3-SID1140]
MRLSTSTRTTVLFAGAATTAALTLAGCSSEDTVADAPAMSTLQTSPSQSAEASPSEQPSTEPTKETSTAKEEKKDDEKKDEKNDQTSEKADSKPEDDRTNVAAGTVCGEVTSKGDGSPLSIVAMDDGTDCNEAMEVFTDYMSDSPSGTPPQGSGAFWDAPNGWTCGGNNYLFPGDEDQKFNKHPSCGPDSNETNVVAVPKDRVSELPV